ncbi:hypothetical protein JRQ81_004487 [Phrynocephalus forsythii]|uniref:Uncharacterized protein n=1 Tax=Phrynocephalus forsythii TaxID=171643 RepID=A0A9Q0Y2V7_9SAUR|nr:hypothetical protein JRQ81_004487 [Phrynocephalus forsythii]
MRRLNRRLVLSVLGVLWIAALLLFLGTRKRLEGVGPEGQQPQTPKGAPPLERKLKPFKLSEGITCKLLARRKNMVDS